jgi:hypothetical protein
MIHACLMACYDGPESAYWAAETDGTERLICKECNGYRPYATAPITPVVEIEVRATTLADIADNGHAWWDDRENESEAYGLLCATNGGTPGDDDDGGSSAHAAAEWSGWLAHLIADHDLPEVTREHA